MDLFFLVWLVSDFEGGSRAIISTSIQFSYSFEGMNGISSSAAQWVVVAISNSSIFKSKRFYSNLHRFWLNATKKNQFKFHQSTMFIYSIFVVAVGSHRFLPLLKTSAYISQYNLQHFHDTAIFDQSFSQHEHTVIHFRNFQLHCEARK